MGQEGAGVSLRLAQLRSACLKDIRYELSFHLPEERTQPVGGEEKMVFDLDKGRLNGEPLLLDFKGRSVAKLSLNGSEIPATVINEHLLLPASLLRQGSNFVGVSFVSADAALNRNSEFLYTLLVPDRARTVFPCFDQPDCKAVFTLRLTMPAGWKAISNGALADGGDGRVSFRPSDRISTYLFSFAAGRFSDTSRTIDGRTVHLLYRETDEAKLRFSIDSIFRIEGQALRFMQDYTGIAYPFQKFDLVAIPDFQFGGMEHPGAIQYKASTLFLDSGATREQLISRSNLLSHETAHMWFGDMVTMTWFNDVWMKEVFANFMADKISNLTLPDNNYDLKFLTDHYPAAYSVDRSAGAHPIRQQLDNLNEAGSLYGNIIYHKAPIVMRQLEGLMGADSFRDGLRDYLKKFAGGNATWPDLIQSLQPHTRLDLTAWNAVWVNGAGRPKFTYEMKVKNGKVADLIVRQLGEDGSKKVWPQKFSVALFGEGGVEQIEVSSNAALVHVAGVAGRAAPKYILFNSDGRGYGVFPIDDNLLARYGMADSSGRPGYPYGNTSVMRAATFINLYENMLNGNGFAPWQLLNYYTFRFGETDELVLNIILEQWQSAFWRFQSRIRRDSTAGISEQYLWLAMQNAEASNNKKLLFRAFTNIATTRVAMDTIFVIWRDRRPPAGVILTEDDYTSLAAALALRDYPDSKGILEEQLARINNTDRRQRLLFLMPALSGSEAERDSLFFSLRKPEARRKEAWVLAALTYLHHPLRAATAKKYLQPSLDWLEDIQRTGDVFFPQSWLQASFGWCRTPAEAQIVRDFLQTHPGYNPKLKAKILQATDLLFRSGKFN
ncbi:MAG: aminopeptidase [Bacteroidetes bacterium]|nr:aminopeptidase [Bacteroidota bacterium]